MYLQKYTFLPKITGGEERVNAAYVIIYYTRSENGPGGERVNL